MKGTSVIKFISSLLLIYGSFFLMGICMKSNNSFGIIACLIVFVFSIRLAIKIYKNDPHRKLKKETDAVKRQQYEQKKKERIQALEKKADGKAFCPKCGCTDVQYISDTHTTRGKQRTGMGLATAAIANPVAGIIIGNSHKGDKVHHTEYCVCLKCGNKWNPQSINKYLSKK